MIRETPQKDPWYLDPIIVLLLLFLVLGPFAFPLLFRSNGFSRPAKLILAAIVIVYTMYLIYISYKLGMSWEGKF